MAQIDPTIPLLQPLLNRVRAAQVMAANGLAAFVLSEPLNIYHATGFWPRTLEMGHLGSTLAVVMADPAQPVTLITPQFLHYYQNAGVLPASDELEIVLYTGADETMPAGVADPFFLRATHDGAQDRHERAMRAATLETMALTGARTSAGAALHDVMRTSAGQELVAVDGFIPQALLGADFGARTISAEPLLRRIRMIKSPREIALMRHAASSNADAARAAVASVSRGDRYDDLRRAYFAETGRRGGIPAFIDIDSSGYEQNDGVIREGRCFLIDAVASYNRYHGDFGRTIFVGTPLPALRRAMDAAILGARAVSEALVPGMHYADVTRIGRGAIADAGLDVLIASSPHSVGLYHTDEAFADDGAVFAKADHLIEPGMVLSIDCPVLDTDLGGTVHLEDMWLVTETGCEPLNDPADPFLQI